MPLRQLSSGQLGQWLFHSPRNLLLEQAVHPLSMIDDLLGPLETIQSQALRPRVHAGRVELVTGWLVSCLGRHGTAQLQILLGASHPTWRLAAIGTDGFLEANLITATLRREMPSPWLDAGNDLAVTTRAAAGEIFQIAGNTWRYATAA